MSVDGSGPEEKKEKLSSRRSLPNHLHTWAAECLSMLRTVAYRLPLMNLAWLSVLPPANRSLINLHVGTRVILLTYKGTYHVHRFKMFDPYLNSTTTAHCATVQSRSISHSI